VRYRAAPRLIRKTGFTVPTIVVKAGSGTGADITMTGGVPGDFAICTYSSNNVLTIPSPTSGAGLTPVGAGVASDGSANDTAIRVYAKFLTAADEVFSGGGDHRSALAVFRGVDPAILSGMPSGGTSSAGRFSYNGAVSSTDWVVDGLTMTRAAVVVVLGKKMGTVDCDWTDYTDLVLQNTGSNPAMVDWSGASATIGSAGTELSTTVGSHTYTLNTSTVARTSMIFALYGAPL
jgi:hypothetical protein